MKILSRQRLRIVTLITVGVILVGFSIPRAACAQGSYYSWIVTAYYTYPYQEFPPNAAYSLQILSVSVTEPAEKKAAKSCRLYLSLWNEVTTLSTDQKDFDVDPTTQWRTDDGCVLTAIGEPDLNAQVALITDDSATPSAVRGITMSASIFPDFSSRDCRKVSLTDLNSYTQILFPTTTPTPSPTPNPWVSWFLPAPKLQPAAKPSPTPTPPPTPRPDNRAPLTITVPRSTSVRTVTSPRGPDCKSLIIFRPWNE